MYVYGLPEAVLDGADRLAREVPLVRLNGTRSARELRTRIWIQGWLDSSMFLILKGRDS